MRALGNGQPAKKRLLYQPPAVDPETIQETAVQEEQVKPETPTAENEKQALMSGEHMPFVDDSFKEELASLSHLLSPQTSAPEMTMNDVIRFLQITKAIMSNPQL